MKITEYLGYHMHTTLLGINISKVGSDDILETCDTLDQAVIWIEYDKRFEDEKLGISTIEQEED